MNGLIYSLFFLLLFIQVLTKNAPGSPALLLANYADIRLIPAKDPNNTMVVVKGLRRVEACDFLYEDRIVYWMDVDYGKSKLQYVNMSNPKHKKMNVIESGLAMPAGLACDWVGRKLYWTDPETKRIEVCEVNGTSRKVLIWKYLDHPRAIAVDPHNAQMYWTDWGESPKIERAGMDGSKRQTLVDSNIYWPNGLTIDYIEGKIYWMDGYHLFIHRIDMDGSNRKEIISGQNIENMPNPKPRVNNGSKGKTTLPPGPGNPANEDSQQGNNAGKATAAGLQHPFAITLYEDYLYWTDWLTNSVHSLPKNGSGLPKIVKDGRNGKLSPLDLQVYNPNRQKPKPNPCGSNNGGCSHLCLLSPQSPGYTCGCPTGVSMKPNNKICSKGPNEFLLLARRSDIRVISLDTRDNTDVLVPLDIVQDAVSIDYDPVEGFLYWTDDELKAIVRARLNGSNTEQVVTDIMEQSDGVAVDWVARNLYWTDTKRDCVAVSRLNGTSRKVLIETGMDEPRAIVLNPTAGHMYWTDWGDKPKIEKANLDGTDRDILVGRNLVWPNGLAIDIAGGLLFWADAGVDRIEVINLNGTGRRVLLDDHIPHVFALSYLNGYLYWNDWQRRRIERMQVGNRLSREVLMDRLGDMMGIKAASTTPLPGTNPCATNNGGCSHLCLYTPQGPRCQCPTGLELAPSLRECIVPEAYLLFSLPNAGAAHTPDSSRGSIRGISLDTAMGDSQIPFERSVDAMRLDFSAADDMIYWTDVKNMKISRAFKNGSRVEDFIDNGLEMLEGLAVDWIGRNVYWSDTMAQRIEVAKMDGTSRRPVIWKGIENPRSLAMDPNNGYIYWSEWGSEPRIMRAELDGSNPKQISKAYDVGRANSLTIDYKEQRLYYVDFDINAIVSTDMTGDDWKTVVNGSKRTTICCLTLYGDYVYWSDSKRKVIERANKVTGKSSHVIERGLSDLDDMLVYHASRQSGVTSCSRLNGGCQHLCLSLHGGMHTCACPAHYTLNNDNVTCTAPQNFLLFSQTTYMSQIVLVTDDGQMGVVPGEVMTNRGSGTPPRRASVETHPSADAVLPIRGIKNACAIDYDPIDQRVYWIDCVLGSIQSSQPNGSDPRVLVAANPTLHNPYDIAVDPYSRSLYWTDTVNNTINLVKLNGTVMGTILAGPIRPGSKKKKSYEAMPRKIAIDFMRGRIYFTNACRDVSVCRFKIVRVLMDGSEPLVLFKQGLHNVSALAVDSKSNRLYWADQQTIETSTLDGKDPRRFVETGLTDPVGLTVFGDNLYWVDAQADNGLIEGANKISPTNRHKIQARMRNLKDIVGVTAMTQDDIKRHPCSTDNGGCSHICVPKDDGTTTCACPNHLVVVGDFSCGEPTECPADYFTCTIMHDCIPKNWPCDGKDDCEDGSDEKNCPSCKSDQFQCGSIVSADDGVAGAKFLHTLVAAGGTQCIPKHKRCDGHDDCVDSSDEINCDCSKNEFRCASTGECIPASQHCDGKKDCPNGSDEICPPSLSRPGLSPYSNNLISPSLRSRAFDNFSSNDRRRKAGPGSSESDNTYVIVIGIFCGCVLLIGIVVFLRHCMAHNNTGYASPVVMFTSGGLNQNGQVNFRVNFEHNDDSASQGGGRSEPSGASGAPGRKKGSGGGGGQAHSTINVSIVHPKSVSGSRGKFPLQMVHQGGAVTPWPGFPYARRGNQTVMADRPGIPGASSSSSSKTVVQRFPETCNPPPSPATDRADRKSADCFYSSDCHSGSRSNSSYYTCRNGHKHSRRSHHRIPAPTPCTTEDNCDDNESCSKAGAGGRSHSGGGGKRSGSSRSGASGGVPQDPPPPYYRHHACCYHCHQQYSRSGSGCYSSHRGYCDGVDNSSSSSSRHNCSEASDTPDCSCSGSSIHQHPVPPAYSQGRSHHHHRSSKRRYQARFRSELNYDSDPFAPPPTPHSQYLSECSYTHGETTEAEEPMEDEIPEEDNLEVEEITSRMEDSTDTDQLLGDHSDEVAYRIPMIEEEDEDDRTTDDADTVLLAPGGSVSARTSPSITERSFFAPNPPPSPVSSS